MEEIEQLQLDIPVEIKQPKAPANNSKYDDKIKKLEKQIELLSKRIDVLYKVIKR